MKGKATLVSKITKTIAERMDTKMMLTMVQDLIPSYDIHKKTGYSYSISIPKGLCAKQIVTDINEANLLPSFVLNLIKLHREGYYGRSFKIPQLKDILTGMRQMGLLYDMNNHIFGEDPSVQRTRNWGVLREGEEAIVTVLKIDIVGNTKLVKDNKRDLVNEVYSFLRDTVFKNVEQRNGRIWNWEGDGGVAAFYFDNRKFYGLMCAICILHEIEYFNIFQNNLDRPIKVRMALNDGNIYYSSDEEDLLNNEVIKHVIKMESDLTEPNTLTLNYPVTTSYDTMIKNMFTSFRSPDNVSYFRYQVKWGDK
jgi:hypothetical protein